MTTIHVELDESLFRKVSEAAEARKQTPAEFLHDLAAGYRPEADPHQRKGHSIFDITPVSLGPMLKPVGTHDEILEEMIELREQRDE